MIENSKTTSYLVLVFFSIAGEHQNLFLSLLGQKFCIFYCKEIILQLGKL